ncbi:MAG TPA: ParB N-terminal domain-containing protein [Xanthobacteraceae bacterium]|nr:ParB N-terminal domain-containing protein [Xanthobacteraceae bacterium]
MNIQPIPLNKLIPSPANVRKTGATAGVAELAAQIKTHGLLQNLTVRAVEDGKFEVVAGRRRLAALKRLAHHKDIDKLAEIPCNIIDDSDSDAAEVSLVENFGQLPMHPADQFDAFRALAEKGSGPEEIAARFGCSGLIVRQRLKLASVSPRLIKTYRAAKMTLDQLMAFTVSDDHAAQETAWFRQPEWNRDPATLRRILTRAHVEASDRRARFVGIEAYVAAGGPVLRDLFTPEHDGYLTDPTLLDRLVVERLEREAEAILGEGWKWVTVVPDLGYDAVRGFLRVHPQMPPLDPASQAELDRLTAAYEGLYDDPRIKSGEGDDAPEPVQTELAALAEQIKALSHRRPVWLDEDIARAGAIVGIGHAGQLAVERGLVRPEDATQTERGDDHGRPVPVTGSRNSRQADELSAALTEDLTAQRTAALRAMLAASPDVALAAIVHAMALPLFYDRTGARSCLSLKLEASDLAVSAKTIAEAPAMQVMVDAHTQWSSLLPQEADTLWTWCLGQGSESLLALLAYCAARSVDAVRRPHHHADAQIAHADQLAMALKLDMRQWWKPTAGNYLARVSRKSILEAVATGVSPEAAENFRKLPKPALIAHAEERLADSGWLPRLLQAPTTGGEPALAVA